MRKFIERAYAVTEKILTTNKKALDTIARVLIEKETIEQEEFAALMKPFKLKQVAV